MRDRSRRPFRDMAKRIDVEIGVQLAIEAHKNILVELRGNALCVVVGGHENFRRLDHVRA